MRYLLYALPLLTLNLYSTPQAIVGAWPLGDGTEKGSGVIFFFPDGHYFHMEDVDGDEPPGLEKGTYVWNSSSGKIGGVPFEDTNGEAGLSHPREEENLRLLVNGDTLTVSTSEGDDNIEKANEPANSILGPWINGDPGDVDFLCVYFWENGDTDYFMVGEQIDPEDVHEEENASSGIERGTYTWDSETGVFSANVIVDTNGDYGVSSLDGVAGVTFTVSDDVLTVAIEEEGESTVFHRPSTVAEKTVNRSLFGAWHIDLVSTLAFFQDGSYFNSTHIFTNDNPLTGVERGSYTLDEETFSFSATAETDTNSTAGMAGHDNVSRMGVHDDTLYRWLEDGRVFRYSRIKPQAKEYLGTWSFGDPASDESGVITFFDNTLIQNPNVSGSYILSEDGSEEDGPGSDGTELGIYTIDPISRRLSVYAAPFDTSPDAGLADTGINSQIRIWALGDKLLFVNSDPEDSEYTVLTRVSESPAESPGMILAPIDSETWALLFRGILQDNSDLAANGWADLMQQPENPWLLQPSEFPSFLRARTTQAP
ncbi:hypothetical protein [Pelagicoccus mobilis]|uniref:Uncharacterized protein n=1 Tax=Pelagicoccus mobilis TaxID=415221 RepID=A0A934VRH5_9BACT|nr:hypothetical protein [Pelagicoccus mobilis]MBK1877519.1 hypothetical protein [Pelagicoccus mobilis]